MLNMPEKDFTEIKFDTQIGRVMAFTMTKIRNHVIAKVNERAKTLVQFKDDGLNEMMSIDILQEIQININTLEGVHFMCPGLITRTPVDRF